MICQQKDCGGKINMDVFKELVTGSGCGNIPMEISFNPCGKCGLLHDPNGMAAFQKGTREGFFLVEGKVVYEKVILI